VLSTGVERRRFALALAVAAVATLCLSALAAERARAQSAIAACSGTVNNNAFWNTNTLDGVQTFDVSSAAQAEAVRQELYSEPMYTPTGAFVAQLFVANDVVVGGHGPTGPPLATGSIDSGGLTNTPTLTTITFSSPAAITPGQTYAIIWSHPSGDPGIDLSASSPGTSPCGRNLFRSTPSNAWFSGGTDAQISPFQVLGTPVAAIPASPGGDPKCKRLRKKLKRQNRNLERADSEAKRTMIEAKIEETKKRLKKLGC
jgi:hypothetical protein